ncbi:hypothetical protein U1E44_05510 [Arenibacter sp. GZD96]|uniref:hypothetical protein n=1 Tax=Aurantibrevibacter litoralis TaxID=3106030 RepID=UPI002AFF3A58|nr:hypothetical protein [Arenibacter sp. GZD-96]MEA1785538.1 hypothetical protein [Arenibacter sp. GZD-96]
MNKFSILLSSVILLCSCSNYGQLQIVADLPSMLKENSGMAAYGDNTVWLIEDSGNKPEMYQVDFQGNILRTLLVKGATNKDWEDLAQDKEGNLYIADTGNNNNSRKDLVIYKVGNPTHEKGAKIAAEKIEFWYPEQKKFPPKKKHLRYDAEALFHHKDHLFLITKNRSKPFTGEAFVYKIPAAIGNHKAKRIGKITTCLDENRCKVTGADISPDEKTVVLLGNGILWVYTDFNEADFNTGTQRTIDLQTASQLEAIRFLNDSTLLLSDERIGPHGGNLYTYTLKK